VKFVLEGGDFDFQFLFNFLSEIDHFGKYKRARR
jgi:hypothetical protein